MCQAMSNLLNLRRGYRRGRHHLRWRRGRGVHVGGARRAADHGDGRSSSSAPVRPAARGPGRQPPPGLREGTAARQPGEDAGVLYGRGKAHPHQAGAQCNGRMQCARRLPGALQRRRSPAQPAGVPAAVGDPAGHSERGGECRLPGGLLPRSGRPARRCLVTDHRAVRGLHRQPVVQRIGLRGRLADPSTPPQGATSVQLAAEAYSFALLQGIPNWNDAQVVVATQSGTCPQGFACPGANGTYCAWHSDVLGLSFVNLPYQPDAGAACGENSVVGQYDGFSIVGGHEYAETITDPFPDSGWWDPNDGSGGEIADKCAWQGLGTVALSTGRFAVQPLFSNEKYYVTGTVLHARWPDTVSVTSLGSPSSAAHTSASLQISATSSGGYPLTFSAPPGCRRA